MNKLSDIYNLEDLRVFYINGFVSVLIDISAPDFPFMGFESCPTSDSGFDSFTYADGQEKFFFNEDDIKPLELLKDLADPDSVLQIVFDDGTLLKVNNRFYPVNGVTDNPDEIFNYITVNGIHYFFDSDDIRTRFI